MERHWQPQEIMVHRIVNYQTTIINSIHAKKFSVSVVLGVLFYCKIPLLEYVTN